jgi:hypothetical protein
VLRCMPFLSTRTSIITRSLVSFSPSSKSLLARRGGLLDGEKDSKSMHEISEQERPTTPWLLPNLPRAILITKAKEINSSAASLCYSLHAGNKGLPGLPLAALEVRISLVDNL